MMIIVVGIDVKRYYTIYSIDRYCCWKLKETETTRRCKYRKTPQASPFTRTDNPRQKEEEVNDDNNDRR